jgi:VanZ family protein
MQVVDLPTTTKARRSGTRVVRDPGPKHVARYTQIISKASAWTLLITIVILSLVPAHDRPVTALPYSLEHLTIFFAAGVAFGIGYPQRRLFQFVALLAFTAAIELAQLLVPGRHARLSDFLIDAGGVTVGLWIGFLASRKLTAVY